MTDDRIVLPLTRVVAAAKSLCWMVCSSFDGPHDKACLLPLLDQREQLLVEAPSLSQVSGDCQDPVKHGACSGCACDCHRHHNRP